MEAKAMNKDTMTGADFVCAICHLNAATLQAWQQIILERLFEQDETEEC
jgi:hypothetical protein